MATLCGIGNIVTAITRSQEALAQTSPSTDSGNGSPRDRLSSLEECKHKTSMNLSYLFPGCCGMVVGDYYWNTTTHLQHLDLLGVGPIHSKETIT